MEFPIYPRTLRRHHLARLKNKRLAYFGGYMKELPAAERARRAGCLAHTSTPCSCWMCGNPRRHWGGKTVQERRFFAGA
jgi:hypothetical protein